MDTVQSLIGAIENNPIPAVIISGILLAAILVFAVRGIFRGKRHHEWLSAAPLSLTEEQEKKASVRHKRANRRKQLPKRIIVTMPAGMATLDTVNSWADEIAPHIGKGFQVAQVTVIPGKLFSGAHYEVTFVRLEALR